MSGLAKPSWICATNTTRLAILPSYPLSSNMKHAPQIPPQWDEMVPASSGSSDRGRFPEWMIHLGVAAICFTASGLVSLHLGKDFNWDFQNYHWYNGYAFVQGRLDVDIAPAFLQTHFNPLIDAAYYILSTTFSERWAGFLLGGFQGLNFWLVFALLQTVLSPRAGAVMRWVIPAAGMCLAAGMPMVQIQAGRTFHDNTTAVFVLCSLLLLLRLDRVRSVQWKRVSLLLAGCAAGAVAGMKLTNVVFAFGLIAAAAAVPGTGPARGIRVFFFCIAAGVGLLASSGVWMWTLWTKFGNPLFPYFNNLFQSPYTFPVSFSGQQWARNSLMDDIILPYKFASDTRVAGEWWYQAPALAVIYSSILIAASVWLFRRLAKSKGPSLFWCRTNGQPVLWIFLLVSYVAWINLLAIYRYLVVFELLVPLILLICVDLVFRGPRIVLTVWLAALVATVATTKTFHHGRIPWPDKHYEVTIPGGVVGENDLVIMPDDEAPLAHVIPSFPPGVRFIRIAGHLSYPHHDYQIGRDAREAIENHTGSLLVLGTLQNGLFPPELITLYRKRLRYFNLGMDSETVHPISLLGHGIAGLARAHRLEDVSTQQLPPPGAADVFLRMDSACACYPGPLRINGVRTEAAGTFGGAYYVLDPALTESNEPLVVEAEDGSYLPQARCQLTYIDRQQKLTIGHSARENDLHQLDFRVPVPAVRPIAAFSKALTFFVPVRHDEKTMTTVTLGLAVYDDKGRPVVEDSAHEGFLVHEKNGTRLSLVSEGHRLAHLILEEPRTKTATMRELTITPAADRFGVIRSVTVATVPRELRNPFGTDMPPAEPHL